MDLHLQAAKKVGNRVMGVASGDAPGTGRATKVGAQKGILRGGHRILGR